VDDRCPALRHALRRARPAHAVIAALLLADGTALSPTTAKTLSVGDNQEYKMPSAAAATAADGDTVKIEPHDGGYFDCAIWKQNNVIIEGKGTGVVITDSRRCRRSAGRCAAET
jgi:hypothetical protein